MARIAYLGATQNQTHIPGQLVITKDLGELTEGELDLLLARQALEIQKHNSATVAGPFNFQQENYTKALEVINGCIAAIDNPDQIAAIGAHIESIGAKKNGKTAAGRLLQKAAATIKKGVKAVKNVATAPLKLIAKGAMEIYLPKSAPFFLYLFAEENVLPDLMRIKRKKAEKFKSFVVNGLGMQEKHFMAIIRNKLTQLLKMSPESFLAGKLRNRVSGISGIGKVTKKELRKANGGKLPKLKRVAVKAPSGKIIQRTVPNVDVNQPILKKDIVNPVKPKKSFPTFDGNLIGFAVSALMWIVQKIGGKNNPGIITAKDFPDVEKDAANAFEYQDLNEDYSNLTETEKVAVKDVAAEAITKDLDDSSILNFIKKQLPFLNNGQTNEVVTEVKEGEEAWDDDEAWRASHAIKQGVTDTSNEGDLAKFTKTGGGSGAGVCSC